MTSGKKLFFFLLTFNFLVATVVPLEVPMVPKINLNDINGNGMTDFIAFSESQFPRLIYHVELENYQSEIIWKYELPKKINGYFVDIILEDLNNDNKLELIALVYNDIDGNIFYIFSSDVRGNFNTSPTITNLNGVDGDVNNPKQLFTLSSENYKTNMFLLFNGSPNRKLIMCEYINGEIISRASIGKDFLQSTMSTIDISFGDFNSDGNQDIFILDKGFSPSGHFVFSNGNEMTLPLDNYPRIKSINTDGVDINSDGVDDIIFLSRKNKLMSTAWDREYIELPQNDDINNIQVKYHNGFIYFTAIEKSGIIFDYNIDPLTKSILSLDTSQPKYKNSFKYAYSIIESDKVLMINDAEKPELWLGNISPELITVTPPLDKYQYVYNEKPDYHINLGNSFVHNIEWDDSTTINNIIIEEIPDGMIFDVDKIQLDWKPNQNQLGFHKLTYKLNLIKKEGLQNSLDNERQIFNQINTDIVSEFTYLIYVNDPINLTIQNDTITIVNGNQFNWIIPIDDNNADAEIEIKKLEGPKSADINLILPNVEYISEINLESDLIEPEVIEITQEDTSIVIKDIMLNTIDTLDQSTYVDTVVTEFEEFTASKTLQENDPLKKQKLELANLEFQENEEEFREKLKTHKKIIKEGENIWVPIDSLKIAVDSVKIAVDSVKIAVDSVKIAVDSVLIKEVDEITYENKLKTHTKTLIDGKNIWVSNDSLNYFNDSLNISLDTALVNMEVIDSSKIIDFDIIKQEIAINDTNIISNNMNKDNDTNFVKVPYREIIQHQAEFSWKPNLKPGNYNFSIYTTDQFSFDTSNFTIKIHPSIDLTGNLNQFNATIDKAFTNKLTIKQEPQSEKYSFDLINAPENMKIDSLGNINWVPLPTQVDDYFFDIEVTDGIAKSKLSINIYVNAPPVISVRPPKNFIIPFGENLNYQLESFDLNIISNIDWKLLKGPENMYLTNQGSLIWNNPQLGHHSYTIELNDGIDRVEWDASIYVNSSPQIVSNPSKVVLKGDNYNYRIISTDQNTTNPFDSLISNTILYSVLNGPDGIKIDNDLISLNTENIELGDHFISIVANDGVEVDQQDFSIFVNSLPSISSSDSITVQVNEEINFDIIAKDDNKLDTLTYHIDPIKGDMVLELHSGILSWIPNEINLGLNVFKLQVKDGHDFNGTIMPLKIFVYDLPYITSVIPKEAFTDMKYTVFITANDMNGNKLEGPGSITIDDASFQYYNLSEYAHLFSWTPRDIDKGMHKFVIKLTDKFGFVNYSTHDINVFSNPCTNCYQEEIIPIDTTK